jgi:hypothetical protein
MDAEEEKGGKDTQAETESQPEPDTEKDLESLDEAPSPTEEIEGEDSPETSSDINGEGKEPNSEDSTSENEGIDDSDADKEEAEPEDKDKEPDAPKKSGSIFKNKWLLIATVTIVILVGGFAVLTGGNRKGENRTQIFSNVEKIKKQKDNLRPFFVLLPQESQYIAVQLNISIEWDELAGAMFERKSHHIRNLLYNHLTKLASRGEKFWVEKKSLQEDLGNIIQQSLAIKDLTLQLDEIKYI